MKKTLIGLCNNVCNNKEKIKLWSKSFKKFSDGDVVLLGANMSDKDKVACEELKIYYQPVEIGRERQINHKRLEHIKNWIEKSNADLILSTDVFDVVFQGDPFKKLDTENFDFFTGGEGVDVNQEPWNWENITTLFSDEVSKCIGKEIICSGVMAGKRDAMISVYDRMFELCEKSPDNHDIKDQAALIVMIVNNEIPNLKIFNLDDGWVVHCGVAGPTQFFKKWGFKNNLKYGIPKMENGNVCTSEGSPFDMVHQFNRVLEWDKIIKQNYT